jgi:hypothetical protein
MLKAIRAAASPKSQSQSYGSGKRVIICDKINLKIMEGLGT